MIASCKRDTDAISSNTEAVRAFMHDCFVPILAKEFLRLRHTTPSGPTEVNPGESSSQLVDKEDGL